MPIDDTMISTKNKFVESSAFIDETAGLIRGKAIADIIRPLTGMSATSIPEVKHRPAVQQCAVCTP